MTLTLDSVVFHFSNVRKLEYHMERKSSCFARAQQDALGSYLSRTNELGHVLHGKLQEMYTWYSNIQGNNRYVQPKVNAFYTWKKSWWRIIAENSVVLNIKSIIDKRISYTRSVIRQWTIRSSQGVALFLLYIKSRVKK